MTQVIEMISVQLPFSGFYESIWNRAIDQEEESFCEYQDSDKWPSFENIAALPSNLQPDTGWPGLAEILFDNSRYAVAYEALAKDYADSFWDVIATELGQPIPHEWECMQSPREYNFTTDRLFTKIPLAAMQAIFDAMTADSDSREKLESVIEARCTSRDGFISFYSNDAAEWLAKPLADWDHNECEILLESFIEARGIIGDSQSIDWHIYNECNMYECAYSAWESCVDWPAVESALDELCADIAAEAGESIDPAKLPYRCPLTLELPFIGESVAC